MLSQPFTHKHYFYRQLVFIVLCLTISLTMSLEVGNTFLSIPVAKDIKTVFSKAQESWKATHSDKT
jgi:hypothetical protein